MNIVIIYGKPSFKSGIKLRIYQPNNKSLLSRKMQKENASKKQAPHQKEVSKNIASRYLKEKQPKKHTEKLYNAVAKSKGYKTKTTV